MMSDEEIEALLRRQPRRMPSPTLWARLEEAAPRRARRAWVAWAGAAAIAAVSAVLVIAVSRTAPPASTPTSSSVRAPHAAPPHARGAGLSRAESRHSQPASAPKGPLTPVALAPLGRRQVADLPHKTARALARRDGSASLSENIGLFSPHPGGTGFSLSPPARSAGGLASTTQSQLATSSAAPVTSIAAQQPQSTEAAPPPPTTVAAADDTNSTYYLEVSQGGAGSALSGSVTRDASGSVTEIQMAYDTVNRDAPVKN